MVHRLHHAALRRAADRAVPRWLLYAGAVGELSLVPHGTPRVTLSTARLFGLPHQLLDEAMEAALGHGE